MLYSPYYGTPGTVENQNASADVYYWLNTPAVELPADTPVFSASTNQLDLFRLLMLAIGIVIGVKVLR